MKNSGFTGMFRVRYDAQFLHWVVLVEMHDGGVATHTFPEREDCINFIPRAIHTALEDSE